MQARLVVFGDSWTKHDEDALPKAVAEGLGGVLVRNYGVSGASFGLQDGDPANNIPQQVVAVMSDDTVDASRVTHVLLVGGANDEYHAARFRSLEPMIAGIKRHYPAAAIFYAPNMTARFSLVGTIYQRLARHLESLGVGILRYLTNCMMSDGFMKFQDDGLHLVDASGYYRELGLKIASQILAPHDTAVPVDAGYFWTGARAPWERIDDSLVHSAFDFNPRACAFDGNGVLYHNRLELNCRIEGIASTRSGADGDAPLGFDYAFKAEQCVNPHRTFGLLPWQVDHIDAFGCVMASTPVPLVASIEPSGVSVRTALSGSTWQQASALAFSCTIPLAWI